MYRKFTFVNIGKELFRREFEGNIFGGRRSLKFILIRFGKESREKNVGRTLEKKLLKSDFYIRVSVHSYMMWSGGTRIPLIRRSSSKKGRASNPSSKEVAEEEEGWRKRRSQSGKGKERTRLNAVTVTLSGQVPP